MDVPYLPRMGAVLCRGLAMDAQLIDSVRNDNVPDSVLFIDKRGTNVTDELRMTPLMIAAARGNLAIAYYCLRKKADVNAMDRRKRTALMHAADSGHVLMCWLLLTWKADPSMQEKHGMTALDLAREFGQEGTSRFLRLYLAHEPIPPALQHKFERGLSRAIAVIQRTETGVLSRPRALQRLVWLASATRSSDFEPLPDKKSAAQQPPPDPYDDFMLLSPSKYTLPRPFIGKHTHKKKKSGLATSSQRVFPL